MNILIGLLHFTFWGPGVKKMETDWNPDVITNFKMQIVENLHDPTDNGRRVNFRNVIYASNMVYVKYWTRPMSNIISIL
jgi:hypothetical protein